MELINVFWVFFSLSFIDFLEMQNIIASPSVYVIK